MYPNSGYHHPPDGSYNQEGYPRQGYHPSQQPQHAPYPPYPPQQAPYPPHPQPQQGQPGIDQLCTRGRRFVETSVVFHNRKFQFHPSEQSSYIQLGVTLPNPEYPKSLDDDLHRPTKFMDKNFYGTSSLASINRKAKRSVEEWLAKVDQDLKHEPKPRRKEAAFACYLLMVHHISVLHDNVPDEDKHGDLLLFYDAFRDELLKHSRLPRLGIPLRHDKKKDEEMEDGEDSEKDGPTPRIPFGDPTRFRENEL